jgi:hypothetical protein
LAPQPTFLEELTAAGRGIAGLLIGNRKAGSYFDLSQRGLVGSVIALLVVVGLGAALPIVLGRSHEGALSSVVQLAIVFAFQVGFTALVLRQVKRLDALVPYIIAYNWLSFYVTLIFGAFLAVGIGGDFLTIAFGIMVMVIEVNIGRIVLTLPGLQIAMMIIAQIIGVTIGALLILFLFPLPPEVAAQLAAGAAA